MAINNELADQVRRLLIQHLPDGAAVSDGCEVMARIGQAAVDEALKHEGVRTTVMKGREYRGYIDLDADALGQLEHWVALALQYNQTLPASAPENSAPQGSAQKSRGGPTSRPRIKNKR